MFRWCCMSSVIFHIKSQHYLFPILHLVWRTSVSCWSGLFRLNSEFCHSSGPYLHSELCKEYFFHIYEEHQKKKYINEHKVIKGLIKFDLSLKRFTNYNRCAQWSLQLQATLHKYPIKLNLSIWTQVKPLFRWSHTLHLQHPEQKITPRVNRTRQTPMNTIIVQCHIFIRPMTVSTWVTVRSQQRCLCDIKQPIFQTLFSGFLLSNLELLQLNHIKLQIKTL